MLLLGGLHQPQAFGAGTAEAAIALAGLAGPICTTHPADPHPDPSHPSSPHTHTICDACLLTHAPGLLGAGIEIRPPALLLMVRAAPRAPPALVSTRRAAHVARGPPGVSEAA